MGGFKVWSDGWAEGFLGWLSRFKLIRLRLISLAPLPRYGRRGGRRDGCQYMYCLPPAGGRYAPKVINAPTAQSKVIKCAAYGVAQGRGWRYGWMGGWCDGFKGEGWVDRWSGGFAKVDNVFLRLGGFAKVDNRFGYEIWI